MTTAPLHDVRFPGESPAYRDARNTLLAAEIALRRETERVAAMRRTLPDGGSPPEDYAFDELADDGTLRRVTLSELFGDKQTLAVYSFMYGPEMKAACPSCTSMLDSLDGASNHITERVALAVVAKSPIERIMAHARARGWRRLRLLSSAGNTYNRDYQGESSRGAQTPSLNVFTRRNGEIRHFYNSELLFAPSDPGQNPRHVDSIWPLWNLFDETPEGRGTDWWPRLSYD
jgi:predicted dithiol-disulfide oxidoreductase (DUF899 family)